MNDIDTKADKTVLIWIVILVAFISFMIGLVVGSEFGKDASNYAATKAGVAEYRVDPVTGKVSFHYKKNEVK
jgi:hypothetical protein